MTTARTMSPPDDVTTDLDPAAPASTITDPYPNCAEWRKQPVAPADLMRMFGVDLAATEGAAADMPAVYAITSYAAVQEVLKDAKRFSSSAYAWVNQLELGRTILEMDPPEHQAYRSLVQKAFSRRSSDRWTALVTPIVDELIDQFVGAGRADLVRDLTFPFPVNVIAALLGLPRADLPAFHVWATDMIKVTEDVDHAVAASAELGTYLNGLLADRRAQPGEDLISILLEAEHEGERLSDVDIVSFCRLLLTAGFETTYRSAGNLVFGLLTHPVQLDAVRADRSLVPQAVEEGLRWECPLLTAFRVVTEDTQIQGVDVVAGTVLIVHIGSANRDEQRWEQPEQFDIFRPQQAHAAFGAGPHICLGIHLAKIETRILLDRLMDRLPALRLDPDAVAPAITGLALRGPIALPVVFDVSAAAE